jgi:hypothetical protein
MKLRVELLRQRDRSPRGFLCAFGFQTPTTIRSNTPALPIAQC